MSKTASKTAIGAFTLGAVILLVIAIAVFGSGVLFKESSRFVLFFDKSIKGLSVGAPVVFRGVPIGRVVAIHLSGDLDKLHFYAPVYIDLDIRDKRFKAEENEDQNVTEYLANLVRHGLRANLATQSLLTGQLMIELDFIPDNPMPTDMPHNYKGFPCIPTVPSELDNIWKTIISMPIKDIAANILAITTDIHEIVSNGHFQQIMQSIDELASNVHALSGDVNTTLASIRTMAEDYSTLARNADPKLVRTLDEAAKTLATLSSAANQLSSAAGQTEKMMTSAHGLVDRNSQTVMELNKAMRDFGEAARAVKSLAHAIERNPESLLRGKGKLQ